MRVSDLAPSGPYRENPLAPRDEDQQARFIVQQRLGPGERLLWAGQPVQGLRFTRSDVVMIPFSLLWGGFAIFWEISVILSGAPLIFCLWGIPFVIVGLYLIVGRFFVDAHRRARTFYGLTDRRALILEGRGPSRVVSLDHRDPGPMVLIEGRGGRGSIRFGSGTPQSARVNEISLPGARKQEVPTFEEIRDAREVHERIREAQRAIQDHDRAGSGALPR